MFVVLKNAQKIVKDTIWHYRTPTDVYDNIKQGIKATESVWTPSKGFYLFLIDTHVEDQNRCFHKEHG